jgi:hypothetical protein
MKPNLVGFSISSFFNDNLPGNRYRGLDAEDYEFGDAEVLAQSGHDPFFRLHDNYQWGARWFGLHRLPGGRYVFTVGYGLWTARREVPAELVPELLRRYFTWSELTEEGKALLK